MARSTNLHTVPKAVVARLSLYLRELTELVLENQVSASSLELGKRLGITDAQVRKDLAHFGNFGNPGVGYHCQNLIREIRQILGTDQVWPVALVGLGNLGRALMGYRGFEAQGFRIDAIFDTDTEKVGTDVNGVFVEHLDHLEETVKRKNIRLAILAVPASSVAGITSCLSDAGIMGIMNFASTTIGPIEGIATVEVDLTVQLEQLSFAVVNRPQKS